MSSRINISVRERDMGKVKQFIDLCKTKNRSYSKFVVKKILEQLEKEVSGVPEIKPAEIKQQKLPDFLL